MLQRFGAFGGYRAHMSLLPERGIGVVVLSNAETPAVDLVANYVYQRLLGRDDVDGCFTALLERQQQGLAQMREQYGKHLAERHARQRPLPLAVEAYAGRYVNAALGNIHWHVDGSQLAMHWGLLRAEAEVYDAEQHQLRVDLAGEGSVAQFEVGADGRIAALQFLDQRFTRVREDRCTASQPNQHAAVEAGSPPRGR